LVVELRRYLIVTAAGVIIAIVVAVASGVYLAAAFPNQVQGTVGTSLSVRSNDVVLVGPFPGDFYNSGSSYYVGVWRMTVVNNGGSSIGVAPALEIDGSSGGGGSVANLRPGETYNFSECIGFVRNTTTYQVPVFVSNQTGTVVPYYPVTVVPASEAPFSGQFSANFTTTQNQATLQPGFFNLTASVTNTSKEPTQFIDVEISNGTTFLGQLTPECAGSQTGFGEPAGYGQALAPGQTASSAVVLSLPPGTGNNDEATVAVVYADYTEVIQTYQIQLP
jgi:hypothetical protein